MMGSGSGVPGRGSGRFPAIDPEDADVPGSGVNSDQAGLLIHSETIAISGPCALNAK